MSNTYRRFPFYFDIYGVSYMIQICRSAIAMTLDHCNDPIQITVRSHLTSDADPERHRPRVGACYEHSHAMVYCQLVVVANLQLLGLYIGLDRHITCVAVVDRMRSGKIPLNYSCSFSSWNYMLLIHNFT